MTPQYEDLDDLIKALEWIKNGESKTLNGAQATYVLAKTLSNIENKLAELQAKCAAFDTSWNKGV